MVNYNYLLQAIGDCEQALEDTENQANKWQQACYDLGNILQGMGRFDEAIQWHSFASDPQPNKAEIYTHLGRLHIGEQNWQQAIAALKNVLQYQPNSVRAYSHLAQVYGHLGEKATEIDYWYRATNLYPDLIKSDGYYRLGKFLQAHGDLDKAIICYQRAQERSEEYLLDVEYHLGEIYLQKGQLEQSLEIYQKIIQQEPEYAQAYHKLGIVYSKQERYEDAIIAFRKAIKVKPDFASAYRDLVKTFMQLEKFDEAIATCYAIINLVREYPWVYTHLSNALRKKGRVEEAAASIQKACALRGWQECQTKNYSFNGDYFSHRIPTIETALESLVDRPNIHILILGNDKGMSACWLLDKVLTHPSAKLTCIQDSANKQLDDNLAKTKAADKVTQQIGDIQELANSLDGETFDAVILQDRVKLTTRTQENTSLAWNLTKIDGLIIFNDYGNKNSQNQAKNPRLGVDRFLESVPDCWSTISRAFHTNQLIIQKKNRNRE